MTARKTPGPYRLTLTSETEIGVDISMGLTVDEVERIHTAIHEIEWMRREAEGWGDDGEDGDK